MKNNGQYFFEFQFLWTNFSPGCLFWVLFTWYYGDKLLYWGMFLKITKSNGYQYVRIVRSYWKDGKSRQQVVLNLGRLDILKQQGQLKRLGKQLLALDGSDVSTLDEL